eukprot:c18977_g1_i3 orf=41-1534(+)
MKASSIAEDLRKVLGDTRFCDILFICSDGQEVPALRMLVAARSPVLQSMLLTSGMAETKLARVPLADIRGPIMSVCVEFVYTDHVQDSSWPKPLDEAMEVAAAARFFLIPGLEMHCADHLAAALERINAPSSMLSCEIVMAYNLGVALYHDQPYEKLDFLLNTFAERVHLALNQTFDAYKLLSERGCIGLLGDLKPSDAFSLTEYHLLLIAIKWCASRVVMSNSSLREDEMLVALNEFFPFSQEHLCNTLEKGFHIPVGTHKLQMIKMLSDPLASFLDKSSLNLSKVSPSILCTVFEPLQIIPCSKLLTAYRVHALNRPDLRWNDLRLLKSYVISEFDPAQISRTNESYSSHGFVASNMCVTASHYLSFEWEIVMLEPCERLQYGFCFGDKIAQTSEARYYPRHIDYYEAREDRSVALGSNGDLCQENNVLTRGAGFRVSKGTRLGVHIDFLKGRCRFKVDGVIKTNASISIENGKGVYPAISMQNPGTGRLQMVLQ